MVNFNLIIKDAGKNVQSTGRTLAAAPTKPAITFALVTCIQGRTKVSKDSIGISDLVLSNNMFYAISITAGKDPA